MTVALQPVERQTALALDISAMSHNGAVRSQNQDAWIVDPDIGLLLVADGVGGQGDGSWASRRAVALVNRYLRRALRYVQPHSNENCERIVRAALKFCGTQMRRTSVLVAGKPSGTTLVGFWAPPGNRGRATIFNVGDSSLFRITTATAVKVSHDHSLHQLWIDGGRVGTEPSKRVITQALGISPEVHAYVTSFGIAPGDAFVACTDGLTGALSRPKIAEIVRSGTSASEGTRGLLDDALSHMARDNVTAAVCKVTGL